MEYRIADPGELAVAVITQIKPILGTIHTVGRLLDTCLAGQVSFATHNMAVSLHNTVIGGFYAIRSAAETAMVKEEILTEWKTAWAEEMYEKKGRGRPSTRVAYHILIHLDDPPQRKVLTSALLVMLTVFKPLDSTRCVVVVPDSTGPLDISILMNTTATSRYAVRFDLNFDLLFQVAVESTLSMSSKEVAGVVKRWLSF